jgi:putative NADH-flavin reductase
MKVTVFGANGKVGRLVVAEALRRGHHVTAFVHSKPLSQQERLRIIKGDVRDLDSVNQAIDQCDAVISTLSSWGTPTKDILSKGMRSIIPIMERRGIKRIVSLTGSGANVGSDKFTVIDRLSHAAFTLAAPKIMRDSEAHIRLLERSSLDWTVLRSPVMNERGEPSHILSKKRSLAWQTIHRNAVAHALVDLAEHPEWYRQAPFISRRN